MSNLPSHQLVSVVIATYNGERFIGKQLDSILAQTYPNIEVIIVDDCSSDNTVNLLQQYAAIHQNIFIYQNDKNLGYVKNFEKGMLLSKGDFIAPSDQDDIWLPQKIQVLMNAISNDCIVYCNSALIDDEDNKVGKKLSDIKQLINFNDPIMYAIGNSAPGHAMLFPKKLVQDSVPLPTMIPHDHWLSFVATFTGGLHFINEPLVLYRQHNGNVFGAAKVKSVNGSSTVKIKMKPTTSERNIKIRERVNLMYLKCPTNLKEQKCFFKELNEVYKNFSILNNIKRVILFFKFRYKILSFKRRKEWRRWLFCIKMFWSIQ